MKRHPMWILAAASVLLAIILVSIVVYKKRHAPPPPMSIEEQRRVVMARDRETLSNSTSKDELVTGAMFRMATQKDAMAHDLALKRMNDPNPTIRKAAAMSLRYFSDDVAMNALITMTKDAVDDVRMIAIDSIGVVDHPKRLEQLNALLARVDRLGAKEKAALYASLYKNQKTEEGRDKMATALVRLAQDPNNDHAGIAANKVVAIAPQRTPVTNFLVQILRTSKNPELLTVAIRQLSFARRPELLDAIPRIKQTDDIRVQMSLIQVLHNLCPANRWDILADFIKTAKTLTVREVAFREAVFIADKRSKAFLQEYQNSSSVSAEEKRYISLLIDQLNAAPERKRCQ